MRPFDDEVDAIMRSKLQDGGGPNALNGTAQGNLTMLEE